MIKDIKILKVSKRHTILSTWKDYNSNTYNMHYKVILH